MKIGIIGSGAVALTVGRVFITEKNEVMLGNRDPDKERLKNGRQQTPEVNRAIFEKPPALSNRFTCSSVFRDFCGINGFMGLRS